jgi:hypothetical protein
MTTNASESSPLKHPLSAAIGRPSDSSVFGSLPVAGVGKHPSTSLQVGVNFRNVVVAPLTSSRIR